VRSFINAQTWEECKSIVEAQRDLLLTDAADLILASMLEQRRDNANATAILEERQELLARCRRDGIMGAFADHLPNDESLKQLLSEIEQLSSLNDLSHRVELCRTALRLVDRDAQAQLWAALQNGLADSLVQNPQGERAENLEQAIHHYQQALEI